MEQKIWWIFFPALYTPKLKFVFESSPVIVDELVVSCAEVNNDRHQRTAQFFSHLFKITQAKSYFHVNSFFFTLYLIFY